MSNTTGTTPTEIHYGVHPTYIHVWPSPSGHVDVFSPAPLLIDATSATSF
jgi:hypothetical protein